MRRSDLGGSRLAVGLLFFVQQNKDVRYFSATPRYVSLLKIFLKCKKYMGYVLELSGACL